MKKGMQRMLAVLVAVLLVLSVGGALAEKRTESSAFRFSGVQRRPEQPDPTQEPVADDEPLDPAQPEQPEAPAEPEKPAHNAVVEVKDKHGNLNIRAAAGEENEWIGALPNGAEITIISIEGNWALIRTDDGLEGYVSLTYLRRTDLPEEPAQEDKQEKPAERKSEAEPAAEQQPEVITEEDLPENARLLGVIQDKLNAERSVSVYIAFDGEYVEFGDTVTLYAVLNGYEDTTYALQWQVSPDNANWADITGATNASYAVVVTETNYTDYYRVAVTINGVVVADELLTETEQPEAAE